MTGLLTRKASEERLRQALEKIKTSEQPLSVAFLDIDHFKEINDQHGHAIGDTVLKLLAETIQEVGGKQVIAGRYGGDEFMVLFPDTEREQAFLTLERMRTAIANRQAIGESQQRVDLRVEVSGGLATYPIDGRSMDELLRSADQAIYRAKAGGRNKIRLAYEDRMVPKTAHYTQTQLERLAKLAEKQGVGEAVLLREALDDLLIKYGLTNIER